MGKQTDKTLYYCMDRVIYLDLVFYMISGLIPFRCESGRYLFCPSFPAQGRAVCMKPVSRMRPEGLARIPPVIVSVIPG